MSSSPNPPPSIEVLAEELIDLRHRLVRLESDSLGHFGRITGQHNDLVITRRDLDRLVGRTEKMADAALANVTTVSLLTDKIEELYQLVANEALHNGANTRRIDGHERHLDQLEDRTAVLVLMPGEEPFICPVCKGTRSVQPDPCTPPEPCPRCVDEDAVTCKWPVPHASHTTNIGLYCPGRTHPAPNGEANEPGSWSGPRLVGRIGKPVPADQLDTPQPFEYRELTETEEAIEEATWD